MLTIDPARRLAQSLGLTELDNTPRPVKIDGGGELLDAMMLDMKRTFDEVVEAHTDPQRAQEIFANPFYQAMSSTFAGTQEYMAMEKLGQLTRRRGDEWDLIVVDTPPSRSALDFLDAPRGWPGSWTGGCCACCSRLPGPAVAACSAGHRVVRDVLPGGQRVLGGAAAPGPVGVRGRAGLDVRRFPGAGRAHLSGTAGPQTCVLAGRGARNRTRSGRRATSPSA